MKAIDPKSTPSMSKYILLCLVLSQLLVGVVVIAAVPFIVAAPMPQTMPDKVLPLLLQAIGAVLFVSGFGVKSLLISKQALKGLASDSARIQRMIVAHIICFALFDAVAVLGLAYYFITADQIVNQIFSLAAIAGMFSNWPKRSSFEGITSSY